MGVGLIISMRSIWPRVGDAKDNHFDTQAGHVHDLARERARPSC